MSETIADRYRRRAEEFADTVGAVNEHLWNQPSPCEGWSAFDVLRHVLETHNLVAGMSGRELRPGPPEGADPLGAWISTRDQIQLLLDDPVTADAVLEGGDDTLAQIVDQLLSFDLVVHRWDIAVAVGLPAAIDPDDVAGVMAAAEALGDDLRGPEVMGPALDPPADADEQTRMLAFLGRQAW